MARPRPWRSLTAAALPLLALLGCGNSHDKGTLAPVPAAAPATSAAAPSSEAAVPPAPSHAAPPPPAAPNTASPVPPGVDPQRPVATVNGKPIPAEKVYSVYEMNKAMLQQRGRVLNGTDDQALKAQSLEVVVADELLYQAALAKGISVGAAEVDATVKQFKARVGSDEAYKKFLAESGLTDAAVRKEVERNMQTEAYRKGLDAGKGVSEEQARKFYDANAPKGMFNVPEQVHVQYILVKATDKDPESVRIDAKKRAEEAAKRAAAGEDFTALAKQYSQDPTAARGGDIGLFPRGVMFPKFEEVAFSAKPGDVSPVFETPKGFNVMKVLERKPESTRSFDDVKSALMLDMGRVLEQDLLQNKVRELAAGAKIAILDPTFAMPPRPPAAQAPPAQPKPPAKP
jgi:parvulin-like peptidyl-prolyl isomerase